MKFKIICLYILLLVLFQSHAQNGLSQNQQKITNSLVNYFKMDRENIHLHLNKNTYLTNEQIWFKGYVIEKKNTPTQKTSNIYVSLHDSNGQKIATQLYYAEDNIFEGRVKLDKKLPSGKYYLQAYTNFMNNFSENESSVYDITILNASEKSFSVPNKINYDALSIAFFPESGIFLEGISNTIGVKISDCNDHGIAVQNAEIMDAKGNTITTFSTDAFGYGKFEIYETKPELYKAVFTINEKKTEKTLPIPAVTGIAFAVDNYIFPDKTIVKLKTNAKTIGQVKNFPYTLVFQQDEATTFVDFAFSENTTEQKLIIPSAQLSEGINSVYLTDQNYKKIGERVIFKPFQMPEKVALSVYAVRKDSIIINGASRIVLGTMSISVLPANTFSESPAKVIQSDFLFDNYLLSASKNTAYYLNDFTRKKHYELDNFLLSQQSKYKWEAMMGNPPESKYDFDNGLTVKGTINNELKNSKESMVNMNSLGLGLNEFTHLNDKNEFFFEHILAQDSTKIYFVAIDKKERKPAIKVYSQLLHNNRIFNKPLFPKIGCPANGSDSEKIPFPRIENSILLDSIAVSVNKKKLVNQKAMGNLMARGYKISAEDAVFNRNVLNFIGSNGYAVSTLQGEVRINGAVSILAGRNRGPEIYIDDMIIINYDLLLNYTLDLIDEIYINKYNNGPSTSGVIKIYTKKNFGTYNNIANKSQALVVKNGFQRYKPYENPKYDSVRDEGFIKLGTIDWKPIVMTDENGSFHFSIPNLYQKSVRLIIEGLSPDGQMVSETRVLDIP